MNNLTDISYIKDLGERYGFSFSKKYGQNFIVNPSVCPRIAEFADIGGDDCVLEIGAGIGVLTRELAARAKKVVCVEIDTSLKPLLEETLADFDNVKIIWRDVMKTDLKQLAAEEFGSGPVKVRANLPYYITGPVIMKLLEEDFGRQSITVMVQKEAAERICAAPGTRESGAVSLAVTYHRQRQVCFGVSPASFYPRPKVHSSVIQLNMRGEKAVRPQSPEKMFKIIRAAFNQRRKTMPNALTAIGYEKETVAARLEAIGQSPLVRAERMTLEDFAALSDRL